MDPQDRLDELTALAENARAMPMSPMCLVNRADLLSLLDEMRAELPADVRHARALLDERDDVLAEGRREAAEMISDARAEHERLVSTADVTVAAEDRAAATTAKAREDAARMRGEADDYVDAKLADFEQLLGRTLASVERGRDRLRARTETGYGDEESGLPYDQGVETR